MKSSCNITGVEFGKWLNVKNFRGTDDVITRDKTEYSSHTLAEVVDSKNRNEWILITISRTGK